ncbi:MAG: GDSL-type esterase/lipase family protein [Bacillota bacterium]
MKIVCIGNSIVNGFPHKRSQCFASLWRQASGHEIINKGENGDVTSNIYARYEKDVVSHKPAMAVVLTGTNDFIYQISTPAGVMNNLNKIVDLAQKNSIETILMTPLLVDGPRAKKCWMPDVDYDEVNNNLKSLRLLMLDYGEKNNIRIIDTQEQYRQLYTPDNVAEYLLDGLHPTVLGHEAIARFLPD